MLRASKPPAPAPHPASFLHCRSAPVPRLAQRELQRATRGIVALRCPRRHRAQAKTTGWSGRRARCRQRRRPQCRPSHRVFKGPATSI